MTVLASIEIIWVIIVIVSVIAQVIKGAKKVASQAPGKNTGADEAAVGGKGGGGQMREFAAPDEALQEFLRTLGGGQKPVAKATAANTAKAISARRGLTQARAKVNKQSRQQAMREVRPPVLPIPVPKAIRSDSAKVQAAVVLEKFSAPKTTASILGEAIRKDLSDAEAIRKAIVLREVLGPPLALR